MKYAITSAFIVAFLFFVSEATLGSNELKYRYQYDSRLLVLGSTAHLGEVLIGELHRANVEYEYNTHYKMRVVKWLEFDEVHYDPSGSGSIIYQATSRFSGGSKIGVKKISGSKKFNLFTNLPRSR